MVSHMKSRSKNTESNVHIASIEHFGHEWTSFTQERGWVADGQLQQVFQAYFAALPIGALNSNAVVGDFGAGSGRWAAFVAPLVERLYVIEPSPAAMEVACSNLSHFENLSYIQEPIGGPSIPTGQLDVAYSIGVLHCIPDAVQALQDIRTSLKPGGIFLGYLYYALENRPHWYRALWRVSNMVRFGISELAPRPKLIVTNFIAAMLYFPLARASRVLARGGVSVTQFPLNQYSDKSFYVMRNDALDRFGTPLEHRYTRGQIRNMIEGAGYDPASLVFSDREPFWCFSVRNPA